MRFVKKWERGLVISKTHKMHGKFLSWKENVFYIGSEFFLVSFFFEIDLVLS